MGFGNIIESFNKNKNNGKHLSQGELLKNRAEAFQNLLSIGREGFDSKKLEDMDKKEKKHLTNMEDRYNKLVSDYADSYKSFLMEHETLKQDVFKCKSKCLEIHNSSTQDYANKRLACQAGCDIKGPYLTSCADTYKGLNSDTTKQCAELTNGKCGNFGVTLGYNDYVTSQDNVDKYGKTLKDGCCVCGGGTGGKPKGIINKTEVSNCNNLATAFGVAEGSAPDMAYRNACKQADIANPSEHANFYKKFAAIEDKNNKVTTEAENLYKDIDKLHEVKNQLETGIFNEEQQLRQNLNRFEDNYSVLMQLGGRDPVTGKPKSQNPTFLAQEKEKKLQQKSEEMKFYFWSILALVLAVSTMVNFNRRI